MPALLARPQFSDDRAADFRNWPSPNERALAHWNTSTPITARLESWGREGGGQFTHTWRWNEGGRYAPIPTAAGGFALTVPEVGAERATQAERDKLSRYSASYLVATPGTRIGFGTLDRRQGRQASGISFQPNGDSDELYIYRETPSARTLVAEFLEDFTFHEPGKGPVVTTPDGLNQYRIRVDNAGTLVTELA